MKAQRYGMSVLSAALLTVALTTAQVAAQDLDGRWMAFLGCWEPTGETMDAGLLCVRPVNEGVELFPVVAGEITTSDIMVANGQQRARSLEGCEGWESAEFSEDGRRLFTRSQFVCGEDIRRASTGLMSLVAPTQWVDVRSVEVQGEQVAWVQEYSLVGPERIAEAGIEDMTQGLGLAVRSARLSASRAIELDDVREAAQKIDAKAVEAWVAARGERFELDADVLIELADAGLDESIIDVVVAVTYPETFRINANDGVQRDRTMRGNRGVDGYANRGRYGFGARSYFWDPFYYGYSPYGSYGYNAYSGLYGGYGGYGGYGYGGYYPTTVIVDRVPSESSLLRRVVNGRGYTQGGSSGSVGQRSTGGGASAASSGGSSAGSSSSGSSRSGRTAKRRGGGGSF